MQTASFGVVGRKQAAVGLFWASFEFLVFVGRRWWFLGVVGVCARHLSPSHTKGPRRCNSYRLGRRCHLFIIRS